MDKIGVLPPEQMRELWQWYLSQKQLQSQLTKNYPQRRPLDEPSPHRVFVKNTEEEAIPAFGCMQVTGTAIYGGQTVVTVSKPTTTDGVYLFNSPYEIAATAGEVTGVGWAYRFGVVIMLGSPPSEAGAQYLPIVGSWEIEEGAGPFVVYGRHQITPDSTVDALAGTFAGGGESDIRDGIVSINHGCGWYTVELGVIIDEGGSGSWSSDTDCDPCSQGGSSSVSASTSGCELTLGPIPIKVVGIGVFVLAYDPQSITIPLVVGTDCVVGKVSNGVAGSASGSGVPNSGSGASGITPWRILRGYQEHVVEYKERWECCPDGTPKLIGKTPIIFVATVCEEIICGECPPTSGSGV